ncbi:MAG TPA: hypothetical protein VG144_00600 [Gaiellaceae bacterium]|nr:hypothetical protein [Gaiellaceae bacterium]
MFVSTRSSLLLDHFRVPYRIARAPSANRAGLEVQRISRVENLSAPAFFSVRPVAASGQLEHFLGSLPLFARIASEAETAAWLSESGREWSPALPIRSADGSAVASVLAAEDGSVFLPFDPDEAIENLWTERYQLAVESPLRRVLRRYARRAYYRLRPLAPRALQIRLRRRYTAVQKRSAFPRWPVEPALHDLCELLLSKLADVAGAPVPVLAAWPAEYSWALVLSHDVETEAGVDAVLELAEEERALGYRSSWNFVPLRYSVADELLDRLREDGFEIGVHGLKHDGRDFSSRRVFRKRLPHIREYAKRWGAVGFRSPATHRVWEWMPELGFDYDSSYPDTDPYEPLPGGCCSWLPFFNNDQVELPITLPQDHTAFTILEELDGGLWLEKAAYLRERGGMALLLTHPDYMAQPDVRGAYRAFLQEFSMDESAWRALPREVAAWWRRRAASRIVAGRDGWTIVGPATREARIEWVRPTVTIDSGNQHGAADAHLDSATAAAP